MLRATVFVLALVLSTGAMAQNVSTEKGKLSYAVGYQIGSDFKARKMDVDLNTVIQAIRDGHAQKAPKVPQAKMRASLEKMQKDMMTKAKAAFDKASRENKAKSQAFLSANQKKPGIKMLGNGIQYRVIEQGSGRVPTANSTVDVNFRASLHTGQEFASTYQSGKPMNIKVSEMPIKGLKAAILKMPQGSRWELYLPSSQAYGDGPNSPIGPQQAVIFDVRLESVK